ncbi:hypothetical protein [Pseudomonas protegens]|uniref:hypothetical protein n=1 Tax=Pseudomonas protegens TaxID=380021 RepID=UPI000C99A0B4|nr:hypothetical protein [Pseudomonas protegens]PNG32225.1 hypothetical protein A1395_22220 [Pseudomonas protegens]
MSIDLYTSSTDKVANLDLNKPALDSGNIILTIGPLNLQAGDILDVTFAHEVTSELPFTVGIGRGLVINQDANSPKGTQLAPFHMVNMTNIDHHHSISNTIFHKVTSTMNGAYIHAIAYAASSWGNGSVKVEPGYGKIAVKVNR